MHTLRSLLPRIVACMLLAALSAGCDKVTDPPKPTSSVSSPSPVSSPAAESRSVALPASALPPSDASIKPVAPAAPSPDAASGPSQASPRELNQQQESAAMPLPGQVNNHSVPEPLDKKK